MKMLSHLLVLLFLALAVSPQMTSAADKEEYSFKVHNKTDKLIIGILVSEDKETWGKFDLGKEGIPAGASVKLVWAKSTNNEECKQWVKAVYEGGAESNPSKFDFCAEDLELVIE